MIDKKTIICNERGYTSRDTDSHDYKTKIASGSFRLAGASERLALESS